MYRCVNKLTGHGALLRNGREEQELWSRGKVDSGPDRRYYNLV